MFKILLINAYFTFLKISDILGTENDLPFKIDCNEKDC